MNGCGNLVGRRSSRRVVLGPSLYRSAFPRSHIFRLALDGCYVVSCTRRRMPGRTPPISVASAAERSKDLSRPIGRLTSLVSSGCRLTPSSFNQVLIADSDMG